jgi:hypothetical protein
VRKVRVDKTLWPEKPKDREKERILVGFRRGWKIRLKEIEFELDAYVFVEFLRTVRLMCVNQHEKHSG